MEAKYDNMNECPKCGRANMIRITDIINSDVTECETKCLTCNHEDYWAYGWYESKSESEQ